MAGQPFLADLRRDVAELEETRIVEVAIHGWEREGLVPLWFGEGDVQTPEFIVEAAADALRRGETFYTDQHGIKDLRDALAGYMNRTFGTSISEGAVTVTTGGMQALYLAMDLLIDPGDEVVVVGPVWPNIYSTVLVRGGIVRHASLTLGEDGWTLDLDALFAQVTEKTKGIFINSPGNPTGWLMEADDQKRVMDFARSKGIWVISDEVYHQLVFDRDVAPSFLQVAEPGGSVARRKLILKVLADDRMAARVADHPPELKPEIGKLIQIQTSGVPQFLQRAAIAAVTDGDWIIRDLRERCRRGRDLTYDRLESWPMVQAARPKAAFYAFFQVDGMTDSVESAKDVIDRAAVGLAPGSAFGPAGEGCLRLCFAASEPTLIKGLDALDSVFGAGSDQTRN